MPLQGTPIGRYYFDEAASGSSPTAVVDQSGNDYDLDVINYGSGNLSYNEISGQRGLESTSTTGTQRAKRAINNTSDALRDALHGSQVATIEVVVRLDNFNSNGGRVFGINNRVGSNGSFIVQYEGTNNGSLQVSWNNTNRTSETVGTAGTRTVFHIVVDTTQSTAADRIKLYTNGVLNTWTTVLSSPAQNDTLSIDSDSDLIAFNRESSGPSYDRSIDGVLFYAAVYDVALTAEQVENNYDILVADDDTPVGGSLTVESGSYAFTGQTISLLRNPVVQPESGSYAFTGQDVSLFDTLTISAESGSYAYAGQTITLTAEKLLAESGSYSYTGNTVSFGFDQLFGIQFPRNADSPADTLVAIKFDDPQDNGLPAFGPSNTGVTVIRELYQIQQTAEPSNGSYYYAQFWWSAGNGEFEPSNIYWGFHPYPQSGNPGTDPDSYWELAGIGSGTDHTLTRTASPKAVVMNQWYKQALVVTKSGSTETGIFYTELPSVADGDVIEASNTGSWGDTNPTNPVVYIGDSPWGLHAAYQQERFSGILGRIKIIAKALSESDILAEAADMSQLVTADGQNNIWWGKNNYTSIDDLTCNYGTGRSFEWVNANKGTLVQINPDGNVLLGNSGSYTFTGQAASLEQGYYLPVENGEYVFTGQDANLVAPGPNTTISAESGSYVYSGQDVSLFADQQIEAESGEYTYSGQTISLEQGFVLIVDSGSYTYTGQSVDLRNFKIQADTGAYIFSGEDVELLYSPIFGESALNPIYRYF